MSLGQTIIIEYHLDGQESEDSRIILERCTLDHSDFSNAQFILVENGQVYGFSSGQKWPKSSRRSILTFVNNHSLIMSAVHKLTIPWKWTVRLKLKGHLNIFSFHLVPELSILDLTLIDHQWITLYKVVRNTENEMINFQLNQSKPSISLLTFGNADHKNGLTSFRIQCRIFLCWGKSGTGILWKDCSISHIFLVIYFSPWIPDQQQMKNVSQQTDQREKTKKFKPWRKYLSASWTTWAWQMKCGSGQFGWNFSTLFLGISHSTIQSYHRWNLLVKPLSKLIIKQKLLQLR